jgi:hypothetical protein
MRRSLWRVASLALAVGLAAGCHRQAVQQKTPPDPLVQSKKPVEGRPQGEPADVAAHPYPAPPPGPTDAGRPGYLPAVLPARVERLSGVPLGAPQEE